MDTDILIRKSDIIQKIATICFLLGVYIEVLVVILDKSAYNIESEGKVFRITFLLFLCTVCFTKYSMKEYLYMLFFCVIGLISYLATGRNEIIRFTIFVVACKDMNIKWVLKNVFYFTLTGVLILVILSITGLYGNMAMTTDFGRGVVETRYCLGLGHPNALHCMFFTLMILGFYLYHKQWGWKGYIIAAILNALLFLLTDSRTSMILGMGFLLATLLLQYIKQLQKGSICYILGIMILIFAIGLSVCFAIYLNSLSWLWHLDKALNGRIFSLYDSVRHDGMISTWSAFSEPLNDNFFDLGIVRAFYWYGFIPAALYYLMQIKLIWVAYKKSDYMLLAIMTIITAYSIVEAHFISVYIGRNYILFFMGMCLAELTGTKIDSEKEYFPFFYRFFRRKRIEG